MILQNFSTSKKLRLRQNRKKILDQLNPMSWAELHKGHMQESQDKVICKGHVQGLRAKVMCKGHVDYPERFAFMNG